MITNSEIERLLPQIERASRAIVRNGCDPQDLVQNAVLKLLTRRVVADYPLITVNSTMKDFCLINGYYPYTKRIRRLSMSKLNNVAETERKDYSTDWDDIDWTPIERDVVQLHCEEGWSFVKIGKLYNYTGAWAGRVLKDAARKAAIAWGLLDKGGQPV